MNIVALKNKDDIFDYLINLFWNDVDIVVKVDEKKYITYESFIRHILLNEDLYYSINKVNRHIERNNDERIDWNNLNITDKRFKELYCNNDKIMNYLKKLNYKKIIICGKNSDMVYDYINLYGSDIELIKADIDFTTLMKIPKDVFIIDTNVESVRMKNYVLKNNYSNYSNLNQLCSDAEIDYFKDNYIDKELNTFIFSFPDKEEFTNLNDEEKERISNNLNYIYYFQNMNHDDSIRNMLINILGEKLILRYKDGVSLTPSTILRNGICSLADSNNDFCNVIQGYRLTNDQPKDASNNINIFGPCMVFGALVDDNNTIPSHLQKFVNGRYPFRVNNYGLRALGFEEQIRITNSLEIRKNDIQIFMISRQEEKKLLEKFQFSNIIDLFPAISEMHDFFVDKPEHCNSAANQRIAEFMYHKIENTLSHLNQVDDEVIQKDNRRNVFHDNKYVKEYLQYLSTVPVVSENNGAILMNSNPFTYGHKNLIDYARKNVDQLFVFVVQEDKSEFSFDDRFQMVKDGSAEYDNVIVLPSGKIMGSSMIFPEYFNRDQLNNVEIDMSLDLDIFGLYIALMLNIKKRFLGVEKNDYVTMKYNESLKRQLPNYGIDVIEIDRFKDYNNQPISAKVVRKALIDGNEELAFSLVPDSTREIISKTNYKR